MRYRNAGRIGCVALLAALAAACSKAPPERAAGNASPMVFADPRPMNGMRGMTAIATDSALGVPGMMNGLSPEMQSQLRTMSAADAATMRSLVPGHRQMVGNMLSQMNGEMRQLHMAGEAGWSALLDSIRQDLVMMPEQSAASLRSMMPAHAARVRELGALHANMMRNTK
jgi:hypothetical protein